MAEATQQPAHERGLARTQRALQVNHQRRAPTGRAQQAGQSAA